MNDNMLSGNGRWERNRIILPEFRQALLSQREQRRHRTRPVMDEQALEEIERILYESLKLKKAVRLKLFEPIEDIELTGIVTQLQPKSIRLEVIGGQKTIQVADIMGVISEE